MNNIFTNEDARNLFLEIINTYGQFLKARDMVKSLKLDIPFKKLFSELSIHEMDLYSWEAREYGITSGITKSQINDIEKSAKEDLQVIKKELISKVISCEKYHKKLKHQFRERFPELNAGMQNLLKEHKEFLENKKRKEHALINNMSERFISFLHYTFSGGKGLHLSYGLFSRHVIKKYNIVIDKERLENLITDCNVEEFSVHDSVKYIANKKLTLNEIAFLASILKQFISNVTQEDLDNVEIYSMSAKEKPENKVISEKIINGEFSRFKKLFNDYSAAIAEIN